MNFLRLERPLNYYIKKLLLLTILTFSFCAAVDSFDIYLWISTFLLFYNVRSILIKMNNELPIRNFFTMQFTLQFLFGPALVYNVFADYQVATYVMVITKNDYFAFVLPCILLFHLGLLLGDRNAKIKISIDSIQEKLDGNENWIYILLAIGLLSSVVAPFFPKSLNFVFYLLGGFKYCSAFMLILRKKQVKWYILVLIFGSLLLSAFSQVMFHDLLIWLVFLAVFASIKYKYSMWTKLLGLLVFIAFAAFLQVIKIQLRNQIWRGGKSFNAEVLQEATTASAIQKKGFFSKEVLAPQLTRINQGWIVTRILRNVPAKVEHTNGALLWSYMEAAFLPRFLAPDKLMAGDYRLFTKYSGHTILKGTSMGLSPVGDGYIDFGVEGGMLFMFLYALMYGISIRRYSFLVNTNYLYFIFVPLVFIYPIRPDCETQTAFGHFIKAIVLVWLILKIAFKNTEIATKENATIE